MIRYLADTHIALWLLDDPDRLTRPQRDVLASPSPVFLSIASIWEVAIKASIGKLTPPPFMTEAFEADGFEILPIDRHHLEFIRAMPFQGTHKDPFDRMLIAQATVDRLTVITSDRKFRDYDLELV